MSTHYTKVMLTLLLSLLLVNEVKSVIELDDLVPRSTTNERSYIRRLGQKKERSRDHDVMLVMLTMKKDLHHQNLKVNVILVKSTVTILISRRRRRRKT